MADDSEKDNQTSFDFTSSSEDEQLDPKIELKVDEILEAVANAEIHTLEKRVAWLLNHIPETRNSDITLQIEYWKHFEAHKLDGDYIELTNLYDATRLTALCRVRAKIQNTYRLFLASDEVRQQRGTLTEEERQKAGEGKPDYPLYAVYADESKSGTFVVVGSMWIFDGLGTLLLKKAIDQYRQAQSFTKEFHFKDIKQGNLDIYLGLIGIVKKSAIALGFRALTLPQKGVADVQSAIQDLWYHLLLSGVEHADSTGRAPLPRYIQFWKDAEEEGYDTLVLANLKTKLSTDGKSKFEKALLVDIFKSVDSKGSALIQVVDLFTSSVARKHNAPPNSDKPKDVFASEFLKMFEVGSRCPNSKVGGDCLVYESV